MPKLCRYLPKLQCCMPKLYCYLPKLYCHLPKLHGSCANYRISAQIILLPAQIIRKSAQIIHVLACCYSTTSNLPKFKKTQSAQSGDRTLFFVQFCPCPNSRNYSPVIGLYFGLHYPLRKITRFRTYV